MRHSFFIFPLFMLACYATRLQASVPAVPSAEQHLHVRLDALLTSSTSVNDGIVRTAELLATPTQLAAVCDNPELSLAGNDNRLTGKRTAIAQCGKRKHYLPIRISAQGRWWVAKQNLPGGTVLQRSDIEAVTGNLDGQPAGLVFDVSHIIGQRLTRAITAGKPLLQNQLRQQWQLHAGQTVDLVTVGDGFRIRSQGKALNNAAVDGTLKVQTRNGQTIKGKVDADGQVMIFLR
ncbi:flagellar basal body P-ring formation chaperone FlgA [Pantoea sp. SOD02]|uniref:flagellar basal body P-ring formation chaperone FlgA n=1 Tax=Pantoea sp. SOD02 TaxID=2970818 RepID=UPI00215768BD|nr:flagellar basal body P-ring formation chaperone FlgA [Pantoea sp. SOD02]UVC29960.1 flagellar basal body P-ring formation chaperone FlgA [Pantoea sp. SOD02]